MDQAVDRLLQTLWRIRQRVPCADLPYICWPAGSPDSKIHGNSFSTASNRVQI